MERKEGKGMSYIEVKNIFMSYGKKEVLEDVSLTIEKGDRFGLIGPNGAGKTTLIDIITGLKRQDSGSVSVDGLEVKDHLIEVRERLGLVPQEIALIEGISAKDNLEYFGLLYGLNGKDLKKRIQEVLEMVGLEEKQKDKVKTFSGGMKRRLNLAASILHKPEFLILDEPTVGVDPQSRNKIFDFLKNLGDEGITILYTSHYMEEVENLCNVVFLLDGGKEVASGSIPSITNLVASEERIEVEIDQVDDNFIDLLKEQVLGLYSVEKEPALIDGRDKLLIKADPKCFKMMDLITLAEKNDYILYGINRKEYHLEEAFLALTGKKLRD